MKCFILDHVSVERSGRLILKDINLHIHNGELTALIGPNGAGKSTLFKAIIGDIPYQGSFIYARPQKQQSKPKIGYVPQHLDFDRGSPLSVMDLFAASLSKFPVWLKQSKKLEKKAREYLRVVHGEHLLHQTLGNLSGGELQRVLLALALHPNPDLLLLDEAFSAVDQKDLENFYQLVQNLVRDFDMSAIIVSHDLKLAAKYAQRMIFLNKTVQSIGSPTEVFAEKTFQDVFHCDAFGEPIQQPSA